MVRANESSGVSTGNFAPRKLKLENSLQAAKSKLAKADETLAAAQLEVIAYSSTFSIIADAFLALSLLLLALL
jgi:hypothetical protein